ncbi:hypothetical protein KC929_01140 [Patescibacteria group bacterium]|nr:hypothetical protein [Patescibacteria group bacterium]
MFYYRKSKNRKIMCKSHTAPSFSDVGNLREYSDEISSRRDSCKENGHELSVTKKEFEEKGEDDLVICPVCDLWLSKEQWEEQIEYGAKVIFLE